MTRRLVEHVHLVRHALPVQVLGEDRPDPGLSGFGKAQARAVATWWGGRPVAGVVTSHLRRARQTATPLVASIGADAVVEPGVAEMAFGEDFYCPIVDVFLAGSRPELQWWRTRMQEPDMVRAREEFETRAVSAFLRLTETGGPEPLLIFTHGGFVSAVTRWILGIPTPRGLDADYASVTTLRRRPDGGWMVASFSETQHLALLGRPRQADGISLEA